MEISELGEPRRHRRDRQLMGDDVLDFLPGDRGRDRGLLDPADRVRAGDRVVAGVLVVVDKHLVELAVLAPPGRGRLSRAATLDLAGEGQGRLTDLAEAPPRLDPNVDVQTGSARGLG